jgi:hypothetical protein
MESAKRLWVRTILRSDRLSHANKIKKLVNASTWNKKNQRGNLEEVFLNMIYRNNEAKRMNNRATRNMVLNNAMILINPIKHTPPANKYKGFLQRYGKYMNHGYKKTILTKAPYKKTTSTNYIKRHPNKLERVMTVRASPQEALAKHFFPRGPKPVEYLGGGADGKVYIMNDGRLIKFVLGSAPQEYTALHKLQGTGLVPSFRNGNGKVLPLTSYHQNMAKKLFGYASSHMTAFMMGRVGGEKAMTLRKYTQQYPSANRENIERHLRTVVNTLGLKGISHGNMHDENIIVEVDSNGRIRRMWLIDFGRSNKLNINQTARNMFAVARGIIVGRGQKPGMFVTRGLFGRVQEVPLAGVSQNRRIDPHMFYALTGKEYSRANEAQIANYRKLIAGMKNRRVTTPTRRAKSASPAPRPKTTNARSPQSVPRNAKKN